jgi:ferrochelatase
MKNPAVLLVNLGTPDAPTPSAVRRFLREFLQDPRVIKTSAWVWWPILQVIVLPLRSSRVSRLYEHIWTPEGSPIRVITEAQRDALQRRLGDRADVYYAMRYGQPSIRSVLEIIAKQGYDALTVLPLYPQHSDTTTTSVMDAYQAASQGLTLPSMRFIPAYYQHPDYIAGLVASIREHWAQEGRGEKLLFSFHGIPERYVIQGDVYPQHCQETVRLVVDALQLNEHEYEMAYQSRFGPAAWLKPYADEVLRTWAGQGIKRVDVVSPAFAADCLETLEEIAIGYSEQFCAAGGEVLRYIPALNTRPEHIDCMMDLVK